MLACELVSISPLSKLPITAERRAGDDLSCVLHALPKSCSGWTDPSDECRVSLLGSASLRGNSVGLFVSVSCVPAGINVL